MKKSFFNKSIDVLIPSFLGLIAFLGNNAHLFLIGVFIFWLVVNLIAYKKKILRFLKLDKFNNKNKPIKPTPNQEQINMNNKRIIQLFSLLITERLKSNYPEATWKFVTNNYFNVAINGGTCRIGLSNAEGYNYAEINYDSLGRLKVNLIKVEEMSDPKEIILPKESVEKEEAYCLDDWFNSVGNDALTNIVIELNSNGYTKLFITESGEILTDLSPGKEDTKAGKIMDFPTKTYWSDLIGLFDEIGLKIKQDKDNLVVTW